MALGCYTPQYFVASFKGVPFDAIEVTSEHGRRGAEGEFPFSENTAYADLGRKIRRYTLQARYVDNNHINQASALIAAVESPGPGLLIHPTRGPVTVACVKLSVRDNILEEQGVTFLDLEFVEANTVATGLSLGGLLFGLSLTNITAAIGATFVENYDLDSVRYYKVRDVQDTLAEGMQAIKDEFAKATRRNPTDDKWQALATMQNVINDPAQLRDGAEAFEVFKRATRTLANATTGQVKYDSFKNIANRMARTSTLPDEAGDSQNAVFAMVRLLAVVNMAKAALETEIATLDVALQKYEEVVEIIEQEKAAARATCEDNFYIELRNFEADVKTALLTKAYKLPALVEYDFGGTVHSLTAAYEIFNDAKRFREIELRNPNYWPFAVGPKVIATRV